MKDGLRLAEVRLVRTGMTKADIEERQLRRLGKRTHAKAACLNARRYFHIDDRTSRVISCHMWPLNPEKIPRSREEWIVCIADKCVSLHETLFKR